MPKRSDRVRSETAENRRIVEISYGFWGVRISLRVASEQCLQPNLFCRRTQCSLATESPFWYGSQVLMRHAITTRFEENARRLGDKPLLKLELPQERGTVTYAEMLALARGRAGELIASGAKRSGAVLIFLPQGSLALSYFIGAMLAGYCPSFMPNPSAKQDVAHYWTAHKRLFQRIEPAALVTDEAHAADMERYGLSSPTTKLIVARANRTAAGFESEAVSSEAIAFLQHSSGTTGLKKGVELSHAAVLRHFAAYSDTLSATEDDVIVSWLPVYHDMGLIACFIMPILMGQTIVMLDPFHWVIRPATLFRAIADHQATLCWMPNFAFDHLVNLVRPDPASMNLESMRAFINCSEPCRAETFARFAGSFASLGVQPEKLQVCYAMAETVFAVSQSEVGSAPRVVSVDKQTLQEEMCAVPVKPGRADVCLLSNGRPLAGAAVAIKDPNGTTLGDGRVGEIWVAADYLFSGYYRMPQATDEKLQNGWYRTSDRGLVLENELYVLGRLDDLLILNGRNVHAAEIEALLVSVEGLKPGRNVAFTRYNGEVGSNELIIVCEVEGAPSDELRARARTSVFEDLGIYPADVALVPSGWLIKTTSGKIARGGNAEKYELRRNDASGESD